jgi:hypothetical protein
MAEIVLNRAGVVSVAGKLIAGTMTKHVRMHGKRQLGLFADPLDHPVEAFGGERAASFGHEYES